MHFSHQVVTIFDRFCADQKLELSESDHSLLKSVCVTKALECIFARTDEKLFRKPLKPQEIEDIVEQYWSSAVENEVLQVWERLLLSSTVEEQHP